MGCLFSKKSNSQPETEAPKKEYSWDKRTQIKVEDFALDGLQDKTVVRLPGSIDGQQFIIQNCTNCKIFLLDYTATVTIDKCIDCQIVLGPIKGSLFFRNCKNCKCLCACQQFRTRDCSRMDIFLFCMTQPIIEASNRMKFGCYQLSHAGLEKQFADAGLEIMNNTWNSIYDFTPNPEEGANWSLIPEETNIDQLLTFTTERMENEDGNDSLNKSCLPEDMTLSSNSECSIVPMTSGERGSTSAESCLALFFHHDRAIQTSMSVIRQLQQSQITLVRSKQIPIPQETASDMFDKSTQSKLLKATNQGNVIGLEFNGPDCLEKCHEATNSLAEGLLTFVTDSNHHIERFFTCLDMQM
ncbi:protein XRP2-like [Styela clava]|uniref:protein XRP2-like n=1 Tax=Styela clava TaxID=7725 RepID=UPI00193ADF15|nr:protein XRP2-like [Styela clava]